MNKVWALCVVILTVLSLAAKARAADPEYFKLDPKTGDSFEIEGYWDSSGFFVAIDIERLPEPRRPKLRGPIQSVNSATRTFVVFGRTLSVDDKTEFLQEEGKKSSFADLKAGIKVEISCSVSDDRTWHARKIRTFDVKESSKIKGTVTAVSMDRNPPDSIVIHDLVVLLTTDTDVNDPSSKIEEKESELFQELSGSSALGMSDGVIVNKNVHLSAEYRQDLLSESDYDLSSTFDSDESNTQFDFRARALGFWTPQIGTHAEFRLRKRVLFMHEHDRFPDYAKVQVIELYALLRNFVVPGLAFKIGRQEFDDRREWLFDTYMDAARVYYYGVPGIVVQAAYIDHIHPISTKYDTWRDVYAKIDLEITDVNVVSAVVISRTDSDELRNREPVWWGGRYHGEVSYLEPWLDAAVIKGTDKGRDLDAWAVDAGTVVRFPVPDLEPTLTISYAVGSGDDNRGDDIDHRFRQTGYEDNFDKAGGVVDFPYYGSVLNPELSNLKITTVGAGIQPVKGGSIDVIYHVYSQHFADDDMKGTDLVAPPALPNGDSPDLGSALDIILGSPKLWDHLRLSAVIGFLYPGPGFEPRNQTATQWKLNARVGF
ncbi:MAG: alginate export family protein [Candidatus Zixiibacteriota bacterium]